jgi:hypothetical protein
MFTDPSVCDGDSLVIVMVNGTEAPLANAAGATVTV